MLDHDQLKQLSTFSQDLDCLINETISKKDPRRDEDLIILLALKQFVNRYFTDGVLGGDAISRMIRTKITIQDMLLVLSSIKFKDKNSDMILVTVKQFDDIFLELLINPAGFKTSQINFYRGGKGIINVFIFMVMNVFQQVRNMKWIFAEDQSQIESSYAPGQLIPSDPQMLLLKGIIDTSMDLAAMEESNLNQAVNSNNNNSAFQLHSQKHSAEMDKLEPLDNEGLVISGIHPEKNSKRLSDKQSSTAT